MNKWYACVATVAMALALLGLWGCEWEGGDGFNTSGGAGVNVNFSGTYAVSGVPGVTSLVISQTGNALQGSDNLGNLYSGSIGSPGVVARPNEDGAFPAGASMLQTQFSLSSDGADIVGNIRAVAVTDVRGFTSTVSTNQTITITNQTGTINIVQTANESSTVTYSVDSSNTRYILEGTWSGGGGSFAVTAQSSAAGGGAIVL